MTSYLRRLQDIEHTRELTALRQKLNATFRTNLQLSNWLQSDAVKPFVDELERDYLEENHNAGEADFNQVAHHMATHDALQLARYTSQMPNKANWSKYDHITRFLVQIIKYDKEHEGQCLWKDKENDIVTWEAYEVYAFILSIFKQNHEG